MDIAVFVDIVVSVVVDYDGFLQTEEDCIAEEDDSEKVVATICAKDKDKDPNAGPFEIKAPEDNPNPYFTLKWDPS